MENDSEQVLNESSLRETFANPESLPQTNAFAMNFEENDG